MRIYFVIIGSMNTTVSVQLRSDSRPNEGRVEVTFRNVTGTICDRGFDDRDARVVCRMLGYRLALISIEVNCLLYNSRVISYLTKDGTPI